MPGYPIELDLRGRKVVVVGLGAVGLRKAAGLIEAGAVVVAIDPVAKADPSGIEVVPEPYRPDHLAGASLVFASATPEVNARVVADARRLGIWVNSASEPTSGDFTLPATWRDGSLNLTVSTSGASPALARVLRDRASKALGPSASGLVSLMVELRPEILVKIADPETRRLALVELADPKWLDLFEAEGAEATRSALRAAFGI